jgi:hypothetical protein
MSKVMLPHQLDLLRGQTRLSGVVGFMIATILSFAIWAVLLLLIL